MDLNKNENETELQYHIRLIEGKLVDKTLSDIDYAELSTYVYGKPYSSDVARRMMYGSKKTIDIMAKGVMPDEEDTLNDIESKIVELKKEQRKFFDQRNALNKVIREEARKEELYDIISNSISSDSIPVITYSPKYIEDSDNSMFITLNDIHYGIEVANAWNVYNPDVCAKMFNNYLNEVIKIAELHNSETCYVVNAGDDISGLIHLTIQLANRENVVNQVKGVSELISQFVGELSHHFKEVHYVSVPGNHSRLNTKENSPLDERLDDLVEWYLEARLQNIKNVFIEKTNRIDPTMSYFKLKGKTYLVVHGDFDGTPSKVSALQTMYENLFGDKVYCVISGHMHHNKVDSVQGIKTVMGGSFVSMDAYCVEKRIYGTPEQIVCICNEKGIVCYYDVQLKG